MEFDFAESVDAIDKVPEQFRGLYKAGEGGKHTMIEDANVRLLAQTVTGVNTALRAARLENKNRPKIDLTPLASYGSTVEEISTAVNAKIEELQNELVAKGKDPKLNVEKIRAELAAANAQEIQGRDAKITALTGQLHKMMIDGPASVAISAQKGIVELLLPLVTGQMKVVEQDGQLVPVVVDAAGDIRYSGVTGKPLSAAELVAEIKGQSKYGRLFDSEAPNGIGTPPASQQRVIQPPNGAEKTSTQKILSGLDAMQRAMR